MRMLKGNKAPQFEMVALSGKTVTLNPPKDGKILLSFYRYASCPLCNLRVSELNELYPQIKAGGMEMIAVFQSPEASLKAYVGKQNVPFEIIPDPEQKLYKIYGLEKSLLGMLKSMFKPGKFSEAMRKGFKVGPSEGPKTQIPADFIIDENNSILEAFYGNDIGDHMPVESIFKYLNKGE
ncbi:MAG: AhpC/TSA family protein [Clostridia bacterium]|nr:AhpC/TSA family protein [Clostridia bacterium]